MITGQETVLETVSVNLANLKSSVQKINILVSLNNIDDSLKVDYRASA